MQRRPASHPPQAPSLRVVLIDDHEISRAACRALLRTEGVDVVADNGVGGSAIAVVAELRPNAVILDVTPDHDAALDLAQRLRALDGAPTVLLTSSAHPEAFGWRLAGFSFTAKADLCAREVLKAIHQHPPTQGDRMTPSQTATDQSTDPLWFLHNLAVIHARGDQTNGTYSVVEITGARGDTPPLHVHLREDEAFYVLDGALRLHVEGRPVRHVNAGELAVAPRGIPHVYVVESETPARWLAISNGDFDRFVEAVSVPATERTLPTNPYLPPPDELTAIAARHGIEILGPPGTIPEQS